jgi:hypothetical protein
MNTLLSATLFLVIRKQDSFVLWQALQATECALYNADYVLSKPAVVRLPAYALLPGAILFFFVLFFLFYIILGQSSSSSSSCPQFSTPKAITPTFVSIVVPGRPLLAR